MAYCIDIDKSRNELIATVQKAVQSANLNFLIGSGCSLPAIEVLGKIEKDIQEKLESGKEKEAEKLIFDYLKPFVESTKKLTNNSLDADHSKTLNNYLEFIGAISKILFERKSNILHKQATIFTTNYDLFIEKTSEKYADTLLLNDGFKRTPSLSNKFNFATAEFFNTVYNTGNLYNYQVQVPSINLIKLHGSLNWQIKDENIVHSLEYLTKTEGLKNSTESAKIAEFNNLFSIILPRKDKFKETLLNQIYYDLLRIYANELDKENTLLIAEGFSFADEHIFEITKRALKNPTLKLIVFCFEKDPSEYQDKFLSYNNVEIVYSEKESIDFKIFNAFLAEILPESKEPPVYKVEITDSNDE